MKKALTLVLCLVLAFGCVMSLAACNEHQHTFDETKWESDSTGHWHPATCEHTSEQGSKASHSYDANNKCSVCDYEKQGDNPNPPVTDEHKHSFAQGWTSDSTHHWHAATCEHSAEVSGKAKHEFNEFSKCKVCDYQGTISFDGGIERETWQKALQSLM